MSIVYVLFVISFSIGVILFDKSPSRSILVIMASIIMLLASIYQNKSENRKE